MRILVAAAAIVLALAACSTPTAELSQSPTPSASPTAESTAPAGSLVLDPNKDYGDKYADGILPVGDGKFSLGGASVGTVYLCRDNFDYGRQTGPQTPGPWFVNGATEWDVNAKPAVAGEVSWDNELTITVAGGIRSIITNELPDHHTGEFPIAKNDPVREYDGNPNPISAQAIDLSLTQLPEYGAPQCIGGKVGVMLSGVMLYNAFDAVGRDGGVWEVQDTCDGHPQSKGEYHYHSLSRCIVDANVTEVIGWALDGFAITGPRVADGNILTTSDLDECHGIVSTLEIDGELVETYHYVMTQDFPYSASCFRADPFQLPRG